MNKPDLIRPKLKPVRRAAALREQRLNRDLYATIEAVNALRFVRAEDCAKEIQIETGYLCIQFSTQRLMRQRATPISVGDFIREAAFRAFLAGTRKGSTARQARLRAAFNALHPIPAFDPDLDWLKELS